MTYRINQAPMMGLFCPRHPDNPRHILEGGGADAARPGCGQDQNSADFLTERERLFWLSVVDQLADCLQWEESDRQAMRQQLADQGRALAAPLRSVALAHGLPICSRPEFNR